MALQRSHWLRFGFFLIIVMVAVFYIRYSLPRFLQSRRAAPVVPVSAPAADAPAELPPEPVGLEHYGAEAAAAEAAAYPERDFFAEYRVERERARGEQREMLQELMAAADPGAEVRRRANEQYLELSRLSGLEIQLEGLIRGRGFDDAVVYLGTDTAQVVVRGRELDAAQAAQLADLVSQTAGVKPHRVRIVPHP